MAGREHQTPREGETSGEPRSLRATLLLPSRLFLHLHKLSKCHDYTAARGGTECWHPAPRRATPRLPALSPQLAEVRGGARGQGEMPITPTSFAAGSGLTVEK